MRQVSITPEIEALIAQDAPVAFSISGGKDSDVAAIEGMRYLDARGHKGPRILIHSHLGRIEHYSALDHCRKLAEFTGLRLEVVTPPNEMIDRWKKRWANNVARYANLECVKVILPWSTPSMRFCTSEEKEAPIASRLKKLFPGQTIINVTGIRREESTNRAKAPIVKLNKRIIRKSDNTSGVTWNIILDYTLEDVKAVHDETGFPLNPVYTLYGLSRFSCSFCIMSNDQDMQRSAAIPSNQNSYRELVALEIESTFSFSAKWLGDVAPRLLDEITRAALPQAKQRAAAREAAEAMIPAHLLYTKGWPTIMPTYDEAILLAEVRQAVARILGITINYTDADSILARYAELMALSASKAKQTESEEMAA